LNGIFLKKRRNFHIWLIEKIRMKKDEKKYEKKDMKKYENKGMRKYAIQDIEFQEEE